MAARYSLALGCKISAIAQPFSKQIISQQWRKLIIIIGCVDSSAARAEINECLNQNYSNRSPNIFWLDCGNHAQSSSGQVLLGSTNQFSLVSAFNNPSHPNFCINLPSPTAQHPELLQARPEELESTNLSCAEILARNHQSLFVNQQVAAIASKYLLTMTLTGGLKRFATYFDSKTGTMRSLYNCQHHLAEVVCLTVRSSARSRH